MRLSSPVVLGYPGEPCSLPMLIWVGCTIELTTLRVPQRLGPYFGSVSVCVDLPSWYLWELVQPQNSSGALTLHVVFLMVSSTTLIHMSTVYHFVFSVQVGMIKEKTFIDWILSGVGTSI